MMSIHDERFDENNTGIIEYVLTKLRNLAFYRRLTTCKIDHSNDIWGSNKRFWK